MREKTGIYKNIYLLHLLYYLDAKVVTLLVQSQKTAHVDVVYLFVRMNDINPMKFML